MADRFALQPAALEPSRARLAALELELAARQQAFAAIRTDLQNLQSKYLSAVGKFYAQLVDLENAILEAEVRAGVRKPASGDGDPARDDPDAEGRRDQSGSGCSTRGAPSSDLKTMFRNLAKSIHPDLALDEPARWRRHSLMAEANRAYAERDEDRLRLILHAWERSPEAVLGDDEAADDQRVRRRISQLEDRLREIDTELKELQSSAIGLLKRRIDDARAQGWDLFAEMVLEVTREVRRAAARLASLEKPS